MSMSLKSRREFYKLREIVHFLLQGAGASIRGSRGEILCCFCNKAMLDPKAMAFIAHGNSTAPQFTLDASIHHKDHNHNNNDDQNKQLCHTKCHKGFHRAEANRARGKQAVRLEDK